MGNREIKFPTVASTGFLNEKSGMEGLHFSINIDLVMVYGYFFYPLK